MEQLKITIITCTLNSAAHLTETIESVKKQSYQNFEHLFIDGGSSDQTIEIIKSFYPEANLIIKQKNGAYDAFNKGMESASGQVIGFLHSDDILFDNQALERIALAFSNQEIDYYCSRMLIYDKDLKSSFAILGASPHRQSFKDQLYSSTYFAHPTYYCKKEIIQKVGKFNTKYQIAADIDWLYRLEKISDSFFFDPKPLVKFRGEGGLSANRYFTGLKEEFKIRIKNEGISFVLIIIYGYHLMRRLIRFTLETIKLNKAIGFFRKIIIKLA
jgi:glycosyltransferase involved in cell wall biosynthesis